MIKLSKLNSKHANLFYKLFHVFAFSSLVLLLALNTSCKEDDQKINLGPEVDPQKISEKISNYIGLGKIEEVKVGQSAAYGIRPNAVGKI